MTTSPTDRSLGEDCVLIWRVLTNKATQGRNINYKRLSEMTDIPFGLIKGESDRLNAIYPYCLRNGLPPLPVLVVRKKPKNGQKTPGRGYKPVVSVKHDTEEVFAYDWSGVPEPKPEDFQPAHPRL